MYSTSIIYLYFYFIYLEKRQTFAAQGGSRGRASSLRTPGLPVASAAPHRWRRPSRRRARPPRRLQRYGAQAPPFGAHSPEAVLNAASCAPLALQASHAPTYAALTRRLAACTSRERAGAYFEGRLGALATTCCRRPERLVPIARVVDPCSQRNCALRSIFRTSGPGESPQTVKTPKPGACCVQCPFGKVPSQRPACGRCGAA